MQTGILLSCKVSILESIREQFTDVYAMVKYRYTHGH